MSEDPYHEIEQLLTSLFGPQVAADAVDALRHSGVDPAELARTTGMPDLSSISPGQMMALRAQMQQMMASSAHGEAVNWAMGKDLALRTAQTPGDPAISLPGPSAADAPSSCPRWRRCSWWRWPSGAGTGGPTAPACRCWRWPTCPPRGM